MLENFFLLNFVSADVGVKADNLFSDSLLNNLLQSVKSAAADKEYISSVKLNELLMRMLPAALRRNVCNSSLKNFQQCLLYTFTANVSGD